MPAASSELFVSSPIVELTCVPCPSVSRMVAPKLVTRSIGETSREDDRSGLVENGTTIVWIDDPFHVWKVRLPLNVVIPVSTTATMTSDLPPGLMSHAFGMSIADRFHCRDEYDGSFGTVSR